MAEIQTQSDAFVKITGLKDAMMSAGVEHSHQLAPGSEPGIVCWTADGKEIFGRGEYYQKTARGKCKAVAKHCKRYGPDNAPKYVTDPTKGCLPFCYFACCTLPGFLCPCGSGDLNVLGVFVFKVDNDYFILAASGVGSDPINDVKVAEHILHSIGCTKRDDGIYVSGASNVIERA